MEPSFAADGRQRCRRWKAHTVHTHTQPKPLLRIPKSIGGGPHNAVRQVGSLTSVACKAGRANHRIFSRWTDKVSPPPHHCTRLSAASLGVHNCMYILARCGRHCGGDGGDGLAYRSRQVLLCSPYLTATFQPSLLNPCFCLPLLRKQPNRELEKTGAGACDGVVVVRSSIYHLPKSRMATDYRILHAWKPRKKNGRFLEHFRSHALWEWLESSATRPTSTNTTLTQLNVIPTCQHAASSPFCSGNVVTIDRIVDRDAGLRGRSLPRCHLFQYHPYIWDTLRVSSIGLGPLAVHILLPKLCRV